MSTIISKIAEFRYYYENSINNYPQSNWLNEQSSSIFQNYFSIIDNNFNKNKIYSINEIQFLTQPGIQLTLYMGNMTPNLNSTITIGNTGIYKINLREMNKNILDERQKIHLFGFNIKDTDKEILDLSKKNYIVITIFYQVEEMED